MIRALILSAVVWVGSGCASGLRSIDRGDWVLVTTDDGKGQELITKDTYDGEVVAGRERKVKLAVDERPQVLHEAPAKLTAVVGEILRFRVNEGTDVELFSDEAVAETSWTVSRPVDGWNGDQAVDGRESQVYLRALKPGKGKLKLVDKTWGTHEFELTVTRPKKD
jgi:hypothetical protein